MKLHLGTLIQLDYAEYRGALGPADSDTDSTKDISLRFSYYFHRGTRQIALITRL